MGEILEIPSQPFSELRPVTFRAKPQSFPGQTFRFEFEWNNARQDYVFSVEHTNRADDGFVVTKSVVTLRRAYSYQPFFDMFFSDPTGSSREVTPDNLGEDVLLYVVPGPEGAQVDEWNRPPTWAGDDS